MAKQNQDNALLERILDWKPIVDSISDMVFVQDIDFTIVAANKAFLNALALEPDNVIGKKCYELLHKCEVPWPECPFVKTNFKSL